MTKRVPESTLEPAAGRAAHRHRELGPAMCVLPLDQSVSFNCDRASGIAGRPVDEQAGVVE
jgi:hypothetical protein